MTMTVTMAVTGELLTLQFLALQWVVVIIRETLAPHAHQGMKKAGTPDTQGPAFFVARPGLPGR